MKKLVTAIALAIALPAAAYAQAAPAAKMSCCDQKAMADCHKGMTGAMSSHTGHDMKMGSTGMGNMDMGTMNMAPDKAPQPNQHQNHQQ